MVYGTVAKLRKLSGGITSSTLTDDDMNGFLDYGTRKIEACSGLKDVDPSDSRYPLLVQGALYFASSAVRDHLRDVEKMADVHYERGKEMCADIISYNTSGTSDTQITAVSKGYQTYPLNQEGDIFTLRGYKPVGSGESIF